MFIINPVDAYCVHKKVTINKTVKKISIVSGIKLIIITAVLVALIISLVTCLGVILTSIFNVHISIKNKTIHVYWLVALVGALIVLLTSLTMNEWWSALTKAGGINPLKILALFLSMSLISIFLDELGFFAHLANWTLKRVKGSQVSLFITLYAFVSILTMFTSNDIIILTLTPFILLFCKNAKISPIPYLVSEFIAANTWSMIFIIGNPTNIYLASSFNISFLDYFKVMAIPTLLTGIVEFLILFLIFHKSLKNPIIPNEIKLEKENKPLTILGLSILTICTVLLVISGYISLPMYLISLISLGVLLFVSLLYFLFRREKPAVVGKTLLRAPYEIIPFVIGMFTLVLALEKFGVTKSIASFFGNNATTYVYGFTSAFSANLINNIPMSVLYSSICSFTSESIKLRAIYSSIIGSNIGAFISPLGALAGIMWLSILKKYDVKFTYLDFVKYGCLVSLPSLLIALSSLLIFI